MSRCDRAFVGLAALLLGAGLQGCATRAHSTSAPPAHAAAPGTRALSVHVETHPSQGTQRVIEGATASLVASDAGLGIRLHTRELTPGHVYTVWVVAINRPQACAESPCTSQDVLGNTEAVEADVTWGAGAVADGAGELQVSAFVPAGRWARSWFERGYAGDPGAEIHLVINDHGALVPGRVSRMLDTVREGCTDESVPAPFPDRARNDGARGPNACALVQDAIFLAER